MDQEEEEGVVLRVVRTDGAQEHRDLVRRQRFDRVEAGGCLAIERTEISNVVPFDHFVFDRMIHDLRQPPNHGSDRSLRQTMIDQNHSETLKLGRRDRVEGQLAEGSRGYDIFSDGERFVIPVRVEETVKETPDQGSTHVVLKWFEELKERVPLRN